MSVLRILLEALAKYKNDEQLNNYGQEMFRMATEMGFPPDMFLSELSKRIKLTKLQKVYIVSTYQTLSLEHRRKSGIEEKNIDRIRKKNREDITRLIEKGETGIY